MTHLIGINGKKGSGKDTACDFIRTWAADRNMTVERRGFADLLKWSFARLFIPDIARQEAVNWCDDLKQEGTALVLSWSRETLGTVTTIQHAITARQALQRYGTEGHRDIFDDDFWVDSLLPLENWEVNFISTFGGLQASELPDFAVITDLRFENEAVRIKKLGGEIWQIKRKDHEEENPDQHASEVPLPVDLVDHVLLNNGYRLEGFREVVEASMETYHGNPSVL
jgi:hypothetical protein